jgi:hypothetical protein
MPRVRGGPVAGRTLPVGRHGAWRILGEAVAWARDGLDFGTTAQKMFQRWFQFPLHCQTWSGA